MSNVYVRITKDSDIEVMTELMCEYIVDFYQCPRPAITELKGLIQMLIEGKEGLQYVAEMEGEIVGFATLYFTYSTTRVSKIVTMNDLYVVQELRGKGVAEQLFKACATYTKQNHYATMNWETARDNKRAQRFYEKMGGKSGGWISYSI